MKSKRSSATAGGESNGIRIPDDGYYCIRVDASDADLTIVNPRIRRTSPDETESISNRE